MSNIRSRTVLLRLTLFFAFLVLGFFGRDVYRHAPPIPARIVGTDGETISTRDGILRGQQLWQRMGGQQVGSIWDHGAYQALDWSADVLHRKTIALLNEYAKDRFFTFTGWSYKNSCRPRDSHANLKSLKSLNNDFFEMAVI